MNSHNAVPRGPSSSLSAVDAAIPDAAAAAAVPAERELEPIVWINVSLMAKLIAVAAFFVYNKNLLHRMDQLLCIAGESYQKYSLVFFVFVFLINCGSNIIMSVTMVFFYLAHIGAIYRAFQLICRYLVCFHLSSVSDTLVSNYFFLQHYCRI